MFERLIDYTLQKLRDIDETEIILRRDLSRGISVSGQVLSNAVGRFCEGDLSVQAPVITNEFYGRYK